jgi:hypothetical protein
MPDKRKSKRGTPKKVLRLPDLDRSKASVLQSLGSVASKRTYAFAINDFIAWDCSERRFGIWPNRRSSISLGTGGSTSGSGNHKPEAGGGAPTRL